MYVSEVATRTIVQVSYSSECEFNIILKCYPNAKFVNLCLCDLRCTIVMNTRGPFGNFFLWLMCLSVVMVTIFFLLIETLVN